MPIARKTAAKKVAVKPAKKSPPRQKAPTKYDQLKKSVEDLLEGFHQRGDICEDGLQEIRDALVPLGVEVPENTGEGAVDFSFTLYGKKIPQFTGSRFGAEVDAAWSDDMLVELERVVNEWAKEKGLISHAWEWTDATTSPRITPRMD